VTEQPNIDSHAAHSGVKKSRRLEAALRLAALGLRVFPTIGKYPRIKEWQKRATTDPQQITEWWTTWPDAEIAVATGKASGVFVIDLDGEEGIAAWERLKAKHGAVPLTMMSRTGKGGRQLFFKCPANRRIGSWARGEGEPPIDVRGEGGYVIVPPSIFYLQLAEDTGEVLEDAERPGRDWVVTPTVYPGESGPNPRHYQERRYEFVHAPWALDRRRLWDARAVLG
jgi:Bifunctional DNA primase/polymerase, N-terminal